MAEFMSALRQALSRHMPPELFKLIRPFLTVQFVVFLIIGILNTFSATVTATILDFASSRLISGALYSFITGCRVTFILGYIESIIQSFFLNCRFTFYTKPTLKRFIKFPLSYIPNFAYQYICVFVLTAVGLNHTAAYLIAAISGTPITFLSVKYFLK